MTTAPISSTNASDIAARLFSLDSLLTPFDGGVPGTVGGGFGGPLRERLDLSPGAGGAGGAKGGVVGQVRRFDANSLWGAGGPKRDDIQQDAFGDCYFDATMAAVAQQNPGLIQNAIHYDAKTGEYTVRLYDSNGKPQTIRVTQDEVADNIARRGGSTADNTHQDQRIWPAVMETAFAKMHDSNPADGLDEGYNAVINGGWPKDAMQAITGSKGDEIRYSRSWWEPESMALDSMGRQAQAALANGRPVTAWSVPEHGQSWLDKILGRPAPQDGLADNHVYNVDRVYQNDKGEWMVTLRNPWNTNMGVGEGKDTASPTIDVPLSTLVDTGGLEAFTVGPAR